MRRHIPAAAKKENHMNQDQTPFQADKPENDKAKLAQGAHGTDKTPPAPGTQPPAPPAKDAPVTAPKA
jgi:hypothetical protein